MSETLEVYPLCRKKYARELLASGFANRWSSIGLKVIYCASSRSLASLELLVHMGRKTGEAREPRAPFKNRNADGNQWAVRSGEKLYQLW